MNTDSNSTDALLPVRPLGYRLPMGRYHVQAVRSQNAGRILTFELELLRGEHAGRLAFCVFNLDACSDRQRFGDFCRLVGVLTPSECKDLHKRPVLAMVRPSRIDGLTLPLAVRFYPTMCMEGR